MMRSLTAALMLLLLAGCGKTDITDPAKPHPRLLAPGAAAAPSSKPGDTAANAPASGDAAHEPSQPPEDFVRELFRT